MRSVLSRVSCRCAFVLGALALAAPLQTAHGEEGADDHAHAVPDHPERSLGEYLKEVWQRDKLGGDWLGIRKDLSDHGIGVDLRMGHYYQESTSGGRRDHGEYGGKMDYRVNVDAQKLLGTWPGLYASVHVESRWGDDISADVGAFDLQNAPLLYPKPGDYGGTQVTALMVEQTLASGRVAMFAGKINAVDLVTSIFPNIAYGQEGFMNVNALATAWPWFRFVNLVMWGGGAWLNDDKGRIQGGLIAFGQENVSTTWEIDESFENGVGFLGFYRQFWEIGGREGYVFLGIGGATRQYQAMDDTDWSVLLSTGNADFVITGLGDRDRRPWAIASYLYQELWKGEKGQTVYFFTGGSVSREDPSFANWNYFGALEALGVVPSREGDRMGAAGWYNNISKDFKNLADIINVGVRDSWGFEFYYNLELNRWLHLTGDLQLLQNAHKGDNLAVVPGLRVIVDF